MSGGRTHFAPPAPVLLAFAPWPLYDTYNDAVGKHGEEDITRTIPARPAN